MSFLAAQWRRLIIVNYEIDPEYILPLVPAGTELDLWEEKCYVSLVGFMFLDTRVKGIPIPNHINFEEVNLRFYVKRQENPESVKRGVCFITEIVPKTIIATTANLLYDENYMTLPMSHQWVEENDTLDISYAWQLQDNLYAMRVQAASSENPITENSFTEFICEHYWGYTAANKTTTYEYQVKHPHWNTHEVLSHDIQVDFADVYGIDFAILNATPIHSVILAEGSQVTVEHRKRLALD